MFYPGPSIFHKRKSESSFGPYEEVSAVLELMQERKESKISLVIFTCAKFCILRNNFTVRLH